MQEYAVCKCIEKIPWIKTRQRSLLMLFLMSGTLIITFYSSRTTLSWRMGAMENNNSASSAAQYFVQYPHPYSFILDEPNRCQRETPFLVLIIPVAPNNRKARELIRNTWGNDSTVLGQVVSHYFLLGLSREVNRTDSPEKQLLQESQKHRDILQSDFVDGYSNLTIKTMVMFEWLSSHCPNTTYAMKVDSDVFLNVHNLVEMLLSAPRHLYITGKVERGAPVFRYKNSKWFMPVSAFPESVYPPYVIGLGYVFSMDLAEKILEASLNVKAVYIEDVYVGLCMRQLRIAPTDPPKSTLFMRSKPYFTYNCYWTSVIATLLNDSDQLAKVWQMYQTEAKSGCLPSVSVF